MAPPFFGFTASILRKSHPDGEVVTPNTSDCESISPDLEQIKVTTGTATFVPPLFVLSGSSAPLISSSMLKAWGGGQPQSDFRGSSVIAEEGQSICPAGKGRFLNMLAHLRWELQHVCGGVIQLQDRRDAPSRCCSGTHWTLLTAGWWSPPPLLNSSLQHRRDAAAKPPTLVNLHLSSRPRKQQRIATCPPASFVGDWIILRGVGRSEPHRLQ